MELKILAHKRRYFRDGKEIKRNQYYRLQEGEPACFVLVGLLNGTIEAILATGKNHKVLARMDVTKDGCYRLTEYGTAYADLPQKIRPAVQRLVRRKLEPTQARQPHMPITIDVMVYAGTRGFRIVHEKRQKFLTDGYVVHHSSGVCRVKDASYVVIVRRSGDCIAEVSAWVSPFFDGDGLVKSLRQLVRFKWDAA